MKFAEKRKNLEKQAEKDFEARKELMMDELKHLSGKYRINLVPVMNYDAQGLMPLIAFVDVKDQYEATADVENNPPALET